MKTKQANKIIMASPPTPLPPPSQLKMLDKIAYDFIKLRFLDQSEDYTQIVPIQASTLRT